MVYGQYNDYDNRASRWPKVVVICLVGAFITAGGFWMVTREGNAQPALTILDPTATQVGVGDATVPTSTPITAGPGTSAPASAGVALPSTPPTAPSTAPPTPTPTPPTETPTPTPTPATAPSTPSLASRATAAPSTTPRADGVGYPTSSDGAPLPLIVTYDTDVITITGFVPSQAAKDRVGLLASANSKTDVRLVNNLIVNPDVPIGVGVRVIELNSARFPEGSAELLTPHANELERVARVMETLPNVTVLVIGHADQRGDEATNYAISAERAEAVVDFLTYLGVSPTRLSSRAVGEADLLTLADDRTALALNRRTEFVFYGVLID